MTPGTRHRRLAPAALALVLAAGGPAAHAATTAADPTAAAVSEVAELRAEVTALRDSLAAETAARQTLEAQLHAGASRADPGPAPADGIITVPAGPAEAAHGAPTRSDAIDVKGVKITPGGFIELATLYRDHNLANDISTALGSVPFAQSRPGHLQELRFTARQSRISALIEGRPASDITLSAYSEFDFQAAAQSANSNETNSYNPRVRHLYATVDWAGSGWHLLAGQTWTLATLNAMGLTPRNEVTPTTIDGQFNVGFTWARQPGIRLTKDLFDKTVWIAVSAENPQTTFAGAVPAGVINVINNGQGFFSGATNTGVAATQSLNHLPDFIAKVAVEEDLGGHHVHGEVFGLARDFYQQLPNQRAHDVESGAFGFGVIAQVVPTWFEIQASGLIGKGIGRYGAGQLADVTFDPNGEIKPLQETILLVGGTVHATKALDLWAYGGEERVRRAAYGSIGYGNPSAINTGCDVEGSPLGCAGNTKALSEVSLGFWQKVYAGAWGQARVGMQYSYIDRDAFSGVGGAPSAHENMVMTSLRYYPFQ